MGDHARVLEEWVEPAAVRRNGHEALEGRGGNGHDEEEEGEEAEHDGENPRVELGLPSPVLHDHDEGIDRQHPCPENDRPLEGAPQRGDAVVEGRASARVEGDVAHGEVEGEKRVEHEGDACGDEHPHADGRALARAQEVGTTCASPHRSG